MNPVPRVGQLVHGVAQGADARLVAAAPPERAALRFDKRQRHAVGGGRQQRPEVGRLVRAAGRRGGGAGSVRDNIQQQRQGWAGAPGRVGRTAGPLCWPAPAPNKRQATERRPRLLLQVPGTPACGAASPEHLRDSRQVKGPGHARRAAGQRRQVGGGPGGHGAGEARGL